MLSWLFTGMRGQSSMRRWWLVGRSWRVYLPTHIDEWELYDIMPQSKFYGAFGVMIFIAEIISNTNIRYLTDLQGFEVDISSWSNCLL